jgi:hypothetical protein
VSGQRVAYTRVSSLDQNVSRQLDGVAVDRTFTGHASGKDVARPRLAALLGFVRDGDTVIVHSMDRLVRNLGELKASLGRLGPVPPWRVRYGRCGDERGISWLVGLIVERGSWPLCCGL